MATKYMNYGERQTIEDSIRGVERQLENPITARAIRSKQRMLDTYRREKKRLERGTPPPIASDAERSALAARANLLKNAMVNGNSEIEPMPTYQEMWERPAGAIGHNTRWETTWKQSTIAPDGKVVKSPYGAIFEWKDLNRRLYAEREADDPDVANIEILRPQRRSGTTFTPGANLTHEQWDQATGHKPSEQEIQLRAAEPSAVAPSYEDIYATRDVMPRCQGTNRLTSTRCSRRVSKEETFCWQHKE